MRQITTAKVWLEKDSDPVNAIIILEAPGLYSILGGMTLDGQPLPKNIWSYDLNFCNGSFLCDEEWM